MRMASNDMPSGCFSNTVVIPSNVLPPNKACSTGRPSIDQADRITYIFRAMHGFSFLDLRLIQLHIKSEALEFLDQDVKGLRQAGLEKIFSLDDRLIHARATGHIVRFHRQKFLKRRGRAIGLQRPHFPFSQALPPELSLSATRLLS